MAGATFVTVVFRAGDGSPFYVTSRGRELEQISAVLWRGLSLSPDLFVAQLDEEEREALRDRLAHAFGW